MVATNKVREELTKRFHKGSFHGTAVGVRPGLKMPFPVHATMA